MNNNRGLVKAVLVIVLALIILGFLGYSLRDIINSPAVSDNLAYAWELVKRAWDFLTGLLPERGELPTPAVSG